MQLDVSKSAYVRDCVLKWIRDGRYSDGEKLPSEKEIADILNLNNRTVRKGLEGLVRDRVVKKVPRVGNFVREVKAMDSVIQVAVVLPAYMNSMDMTSPMASWKKSLSDNAQSTVLGMHPLVSCIQRAAYEALDFRKYQVTTFFYDADTFWLDAGQILQKRRFDGVLLWPVKDINLDDVKRLISSGIKIVCLHRCYSLMGMDISCVHLNYSETLAKSLEHLYEIGHRKIMLVQYDVKPLRNEQNEILDRFRKRVGKELPEDFVFHLNNAHNQCDYEALNDIFSRSWKPSAIVAEDEFIATLLMQKLYRHGQQVPQDVSLVSLHNSLPRHFLHPLSSPNTLELETQKVSIASEILIKLLNGDECDSQEIVLGGNISWTQSVRSISPQAAGNVNHPEYHEASKAV